MFFNRRKRYNGDVSALLPVFRIDIEEAGVMKFLTLSDVAWANKYNVYEAAVFVAYAWAAGFYERHEIQNAESFIKNILQPVQSDWLKQGIVRKELIERWTKKLEKFAAKAKDEN